MGDEVAARDLATGAQVWRKVTETFTRHSEGLISLRINGEEILTTSEHPFRVKRGEHLAARAVWYEGEGDPLSFVGAWIAAADLRCGDVLETAAGETRLEAVGRVGGLFTVYNLEVEDEHNYFVGSDGVLVHNADLSYEDRWLQLANEPNSRLSKQLRYHINTHGGAQVREKFGLELAHPPKQPNAMGFDYRNAVPKTTADHRGIQHRYLKIRKTGVKISLPKKKRLFGKLRLPPLGQLP